MNPQGRTGILQIAVFYRRDSRSLPTLPARALSGPILPANKREGVHQPRASFGGEPRPGGQSRHPFMLAVSSFPFAGRLGVAGETAGSPPPRSEWTDE